MVTVGGRGVGVRGQGGWAKVERMLGLRKGAIFFLFNFFEFFFCKEGVLFVSVTMRQ